MIISKHLVAGTLAAVVLFSIGMVQAENAYADEEAPTAQQTAAQFARGAQSWSNNCARCHNMRDPNEFPDDQWKAVVSHMRVRAGLTGQESRDILSFLQSSN